MNYNSFHPQEWYANPGMGLGADGMSFADMNFDGMNLPEFDLPISTGNVEKQRMSPARQSPPADEFGIFGGFTSENFEDVIDWNGGANSSPSSDEAGCHDRFFHEFDRSIEFPMMTESSPSASTASIPHTHSSPLGLGLAAIPEAPEEAEEGEEPKLDDVWLRFLDNITGREEAEADLSYLNPYEKFKIDGLDNDIWGRLVISTRNPSITPGPRAPSEYTFRNGPPTVVDDDGSSGCTHKPQKARDAASISASSHAASSSYHTSSSISTPLTGFSNNSERDISRARMEQRRKRKSSRRKSHTAGSTITSNSGSASLRNPLECSSNAEKIPAGKITFPCTFCPETFTGLFNWWRHEDSIHLNSTSYRCAPDGFLVPYTGPPPEDNAPPPTHECTYCTPLPDFLRMTPDSRLAELTRLYTPLNLPMDLPALHDLHLSALRDPVHFSELHRRIHRLPLDPTTQCTEMFARKESLRQHLEHSHRSARRDVVDRWKVSLLAPGQEFLSRCGYCGVEMSGWEERKKHLKAEYARGRRIEEWRGGWGLSEEWEGRLQRAKLPEEFCRERAGGGSGGDGGE